MNRHESIDKTVAKNIQMKQNRNNWKKEEIYKNAQYIIHLYRPKKILKGKIAQSQGGLSGSNPLSSDDSWDSQMGSWSMWAVAKKTTVKTKLAQGAPSGSNPLILDGSRDGQAGGWTALTVAKGIQKGELENNSIVGSQKT
jgi:hypothetical protein